MEQSKKAGYRCHADFVLDVKDLDEGECQEVVEWILALDDFLELKKIMLKRKKELASEVGPAQALPPYAACWLY